MSLDRAVDGAKLDAGLSDTADVLGAWFQILSGANYPPTLSWFIDAVAIQGISRQGAGFSRDIYEYLQAHSPTGSGIKVVSGTKTLTEAARRVTVETGETTTGKLLFAIVTQATPTYNVNGTIGAIRSKWPVSVTQGGDTINNVISATMEARSSYEDYIGLTLIGNSELAATFDDDEIEFVSRTATYSFFAGTYKWYAFYGEVFSHNEPE